MGGFFDKNYLHENVLNAVHALKPLAQEVGLTLSQLALAWVLRDSGVASAIIGSTKPEQVEENVGASGKRLSNDLLLRMDSILLPAKAA
jgi:aryl-alcohol dehydrogenase-like predicted oxidoreductase